MRHARRKRFLGAFYKRLSCAGDRKSQKENAYWKRPLNLAHGESPFSGFGLAVSGSFFLPPKIPNIFCKGFFFFSPVCAEGSAGTLHCLPAPHVPARAQIPLGRPQVLDLCASALLPLQVG